MGQVFFETYLKRDNHIVIAAVRDITSSSSKGLLDLPAGRGSKPILIKLDGVSDTDGPAAVETLKNEHGVTYLDLVIANAGIAKLYDTVLNSPVSSFREHYETNTLGYVRAYQALKPLFDSADAPRFVLISSFVGSIGESDTYTDPNTAYAHSKTACNFIMAKIHHENKQLCSFAISPGWVKTEMGSYGASQLGGEPTLSKEESVGGTIKVIDTATRDKTSGRFKSYAGTEQAW